MTDGAKMEPSTDTDERMLNQNRQLDFDWADKQLPAGVTRQDVCVWTQDSDGLWNTSCGVMWVFTDGGPAENRANFCHHCGGVLLADQFAEDGAQDPTIPRNMEWPEELCPKPAQGFEIDSRGVLVRTEHVRPSSDDARDAEYWRWLMRNLDAGEGGPDTVVTGLLFDRPAEEWPTVVAEQIKRESQDAEREIRPVLSGCMVRAAEQMFERGDQPDISSTPEREG